jgi:hypothetical protein
MINKGKLLNAHINVLVIANIHLYSNTKEEIYITTFVTTNALRVSHMYAKNT